MSGFDGQIVPYLTVEVGFEEAGNPQSLATPYGDVVWTDITDRVRASSTLTFQRGTETGMTASTPTAGQLTLTVENDNGDFTPGLSGAYGPITTEMPIRVSGYTVAGDTGTGPYSPQYGAEFDATASAPIPLWTGFVTDVDWRVDNGAVVAVISASDIVAAAARATCSPWLPGRIVTHDPIGYWPLTDATTATTAASGLPGGGIAAVKLGDATASLELGVSSDLSPDGESVAAFTPLGQWQELYFYAGGGITLAGSGDVAVSAWVRPTARGLDRGIASLLSSSVDAPMSLAVTTSGALQVTETSASVAYSGVYGPAGTIPLDTWTHVYVERDHSQVGSFAARFRVWIDGVEVALASGGGSLSAVTATGCDVFIGYLYGDPFTGQLGHVAVFDTIAGDARAESLADRGTGSPTAAARFTDLPSVTPTPDALATWLTADATNLTTISAQSTNNKPLLDVAQEVATTARATLVATGEGRLRLLSAASRAVASDSAGVTVSAESDVLTFEGGFSIDDTDRAGRRSVTLRPSGVTATARRSTNPGLRSDASEVWSTDLNLAASIAYAAVNADDVPKSPRLSLSMEWLTHSGNVDSVLPLDIGDRLIVTDLPASAPAASVDLIVEYIQHTVSAAGWVVTVATSAPTAGWVLDDAALSLLADTTILGV